MARATALKKQRHRRSRAPAGLELFLKHFRTMGRLSSDALAVVTRELKVLSANPVTIERMGVQDDGRGMSLLAWFQPEDHERVRTWLLTSWNTAATATAPSCPGVRLRTERLPSTYVTITMSAGADDEIAVLSFGFESAQAAKERADLILEASGLGSWDWNLETNDVHFDTRWCAMIGLRHEETPQTFATWDERLHPDDKPKAYRDVKRHLEGETSWYENLHRLRHRDGHWVHILARGRISGRNSEGKPVRFTGIHFDVTEQQDIKNQVRAVTDALQVGFWEYHFESGKLLWDTNMHTLYGCGAGDFGGRYEDWARLLTPESQRLAAARMEEAMTLDGAGAFTYEIITPAGETRFLGSRFTVVRDSTGRPLALYGINWDRTNEVKLENSLHEARLKSMQSAKLALLGEMAGSIAHEINNPLTIILGKAEHIMRQIDKGNPDLARMDRDLQLVLKTADRIARIVKGLKVFARQSDKDPLRREKASAIIEDTLELCQEKFHQNNVELRFARESDGEIMCRASQIAQIVMNLLSNAYDAVSKTPACWVEIRLEQTDDSVTIAVTDSGPGIPPDVVKKLMEPFFTTKEAGKGTGLGLSIARTIAEEHGASFFYDASCPNTRFVLKLPVAPPQQVIETPAATTASRPLSAA